MNWERTSQSLNYIAARSHVEPIGAYVAELIDFMTDNKVMKLEDVNLIGFSLGAHMAGVGKWENFLCHTMVVKKNVNLLFWFFISLAGKHVRSGKLPKITGLDPGILNYEFIYFFDYPYWYIYYNI